MTKGEFLQILEGFPGKAELARATSPEAIRLEYAYVNFEKIAEQMNKKSFRINLPDEENVWYKFISLLVLATDDEIDVEGQASLLHTSERVAERIIQKFNDYFWKGDRIIHTLEGINLEELIEFARNGEQLLFL